MASGWPNEAGLECLQRIHGFFQSLPFGQVVGCLPDANAWKDYWRCSQITSQVSFLPQDLGQQASSQLLSNVVRLLSKLPQEKTSKLSVLAYSTPSPCTNKGMFKSSQPFSKVMGWPVNLSSPVLATPSQNSLSLPFLKLNS